MSHTVTLAQRIKQLEKAQADLPNILADVAKGATMRAIEAAQDATPPKAGTDRLPGTHTITGELKAHWATDSKTEPIGGALSGGKTFITILANNMEYASYVDQGHRMDKHFVPGLYIGINGELEYDPQVAELRAGGLMVGTKTKYVKGEFMTDKGKEAYEKAVLAELGKRVEEAFK